MVSGDLTWHGRGVGSVFDLLGRDENDLTAALGFTLARSPALLSLVLRRLLSAGTAGTASLRLEERGGDGRTDLEIEVGPDLVIIEAKRGWLLPGDFQLDRYASRVTRHGGGALVSLSAASADWARENLPAAVGDVPVVHLPWSEVRQDAAAASTAARGRERAWLDEFTCYMGKAVPVRDPADSWAYCVSVSNGRPGNGGSRTFRDFVTRDGCYFHPWGWGSGWPKTPPNFLAVRWGNQVQQVRRIVGAEIIPSLQARWPDIPEDPETTRSHALYNLGPPLPGTPVPSGGKYRASRPWVIVDLLLTSGTLRDAIEQTKKIAGG
jgi:hypothetical protein